MPKIELENFVYYGKLFEVYGNLLSHDRQEIMNLYFNCNMTLVEIADEKKVSRQAILDAIKKSCKKLDEFENALNLIKDKEKINSALIEILKLCEEQDIDTIKQKVEKILGEM